MNYSQPKTLATPATAVEPRNPAVPRTLDSLHTSLDGLGQDLTQLADRLAGILSSPRPQEVEKGSDRQSTGCHVSDMIYGADCKVEALRGAVHDLLTRVQV